MQRMMPLVRPGRVQAVAARVPAADEAGVAAVALGDQEQRAAQVRGERVHLDGERLQDVGRRLVGDGVHGVQPQPVAVIIAQPHQRVVDDEAPHLVAARPVEVDRVTPAGLVLGREVRAELRQVVPVRPEVVVDDIHDHAESPGVRGVDQPLEPVRPAVGVMRGVQADAVVTPAPAAGELGHRHQLDGVDAQLGQVAQVPDRPVEGARGREGADMALVQDGPGQRQPAPAAVVPAERGVVDDPGRAVHPVRLRAGARVGPGRAAIQAVRVVAARPRIRRLPRPPAAIGRGHRHRLPVEHQVNPLRPRGPDPEFAITPPWPAPRPGNAGTGRPR